MRIAARWLMLAGACLVAVCGLQAAPADGHGKAQARAMRKIFISVDMEGIAGVVQPAQLGPDGFEYAKAREWATGEVNAAIQGARDAGATEFVVCDAHGNAQNLLIDQLPDDVRVVRGFPRPLEMMQGIDETFDAALFVGYHASEWSVESRPVPGAAHLPHAGQDVTSRHHRLALAAVVLRPASPP